MKKITMPILVLVLGSVLSASMMCEEDIAPKYDVDKSNPNWVISFDERVKVRVHTSRQWAPYSDIFGGPKNQIVVKPGQWIEMYIYHNGRWVWSLVTDADHR